nr:Universal stress protein UspA-like related nucleotide-binding protein [Methylocystis sp. SC2]
MSFKTILVPLSGTERDSAVIDVALQLGHEFKAHIEALYAKKEREERTVGERTCFMDANHVRTFFANRCKSYASGRPGDKALDGLSVNFKELQGVEADLIAEHGRLADLIVLSHPSSSDTDWPSISIQTALRETARPVLLVPQAARQLGKSNIIAWNGSLEATRAVAFAIPILLRGASTLVVTLGNHDIEPSGRKVVDYLKWHGIKAKNAIIPVENSSESSTLLAASFDAGADLIILGAYTRYRTGRPAFGSMTKQMITQNKLPVLMAH